MFKWLLFNGLLFWLFSLLVPNLIAATAALLMTVGGFFHPENSGEYKQFKRYTLWVSKSDPLAKYAKNLN